MDRLRRRRAHRRYVADSDREESTFIAKEIEEITDYSIGGSSSHKYSDIAVFYRTNTGSRAIEEVFVRHGIPYKVVGGTKFYERKEVRDVVAYLRVIANPDDSVSLRRILNTPPVAASAIAPRPVSPCIRRTPDGVSTSR